MSTSQFEFKEIESSVSPYCYRPEAKVVHFDENTHYNFLVFDIETNTMGKSAEICQLAVTDQSGSNTSSQYILPSHDIDANASEVNKLEVVSVNGQRRLVKNDEDVPTVVLNKALTSFLHYVSESINRVKTSTNQGEAEIRTILMGHNASTFDTPILLRNAGKEFAAKLQSMNVWIADSIPLFKTLRKAKYPLLKNEDGSFPKINLTAIYETLFHEGFQAHDALEDVLALRKILFDSKLELSTKTIIEYSSPVNVCHAFYDMNYLDQRHNLVQTFKGKLFNSTTKGPLTKSMVEKIAGSGLSYDDLRNTYTNFHADGIVSLLSNPPTLSSSLLPRVTKNHQILETVVQHFKNNAGI